MDSSNQPTTTSNAHAGNAQSTGSGNSSARPIEGSRPSSSTGAGSQQPSQNGQGHSRQTPQGQNTNGQGQHPYQQNQQTQQNGQQLDQHQQNNLQQQLDMLDLKEDDKKKFLELNVAGKTERRTVQEWLDLANKGFAATKVWQESAVARQQAAEWQQLQQLAKTNPDIAAQRLFQQNPELLNKFADALVAKRLEKQMMSPIERENAELREQRETEMQQQQEFQRQQHARHQQQLNTAAQQQVDQELQNELKRVGLPDNKYTRSLIAHKVFQSWDEREAMGLQPLSTTEAADMLTDELFGLWHNTFDGLSDEQLLKAIGDKTSERLNDLRVNRITGQKGQPRDTQKRPAGYSPSTSGPTQKPMTEDEYRAYHHKLRYGN